METVRVDVRGKRENEKREETWVTKPEGLGVFPPPPLKGNAQVMNREGK